MTEKTEQLVGQIAQLARVLLDELDRELDALDALYDDAYFEGLELTEREG